MKYNAKRGEGYILPCVLIIIVCMMLSVFIMFANAVSIVKQTERNSRVVLDSYVMTNSIAIYNSIKQGNDKNAILDSQNYSDNLCEFCTFVCKDDYLYNYDADGEVLFYMTVPTVEFVNANSLKIQARYTVYIPIYFSGKQVGMATVPIKVTSKYLEKN